MPKYYLSMCSQYRDEAKWLREWCVYHLLVGCEHLYLLSNDDPGSDAERDALIALLPFMEQGVLTMGINTSRKPDWQATGWSQIMIQWGPETKWLACTDVDAFLFPVPVASMSVVPFLKTRDSSTCAGLAVGVIPFGDSHLLKSPQLQTESFVNRASLIEPGTANYILQPSRMEQFELPGYGKVRDGYSMQDTNGQLEGSPKVGKRQWPGDQLRFNHYSIRSLEDWQRKVSRGWPEPEASLEWRERRSEIATHKHRMLNKNDVFDNSMVRFVPELRRRLGELL